MSTTRIVRLRRALAFAAALAWGWSWSAEYPTKPLTLIVASVPGGAQDAVARLIADRLSQRLGQRVVVEYKPGGSFTIGAAAVARAQPDGYTLLIASEGAMIVAPQIMRDVPYDPIRDFTPVTLLGVIQLVLVAHPSLKVANVQDFIDAAKLAPGKIQYASGGEGSSHNLAMLQLQLGAGIRLEHIPYKGGPQGFADLIGGHVPVMFIAPGTAIRHVRDGKLVALGVASKKPIPSYPGVPPISETIPGYEWETWTGLFMPNGAPREIVTILNREVAAIVAVPEVSERMEGVGIVPSVGSPEALLERIKNDTEKTARLFRAVGIKPR